MTSLHRPDLVIATARNLAAWHESSVAALGFDSHRSDGEWTAWEAIPAIYFNCILLRPPPNAREAANTAHRIGARFADSSRHAVICDPWAAVRLEEWGFHENEPQPWMHRPAGPVPGSRASAADLEVAEVRDHSALEAYEAVSAEGFAAPRAHPFVWHAPPILADRRFGIWLGRVDGAPVSAAMAFVEAGVVGIYGVTTVPRARRRGYAEALTAKALSVEPELPSVLQPSAEAEAIYRRMGYERFASFAVWSRPAS